MPLESLSQPFNPDEPGRKLREVQIEQEEEPRTIAQALWEKISRPGISPFCGTEPGTWKKDMESAGDFRESEGFIFEVPLLLLVRMNVDGYIPTEREHQRILQGATEEQLEMSVKLLFILGLEKMNPAEAKIAYEDLRALAEASPKNHWLQKAFEFGTETGDMDSRMLSRLIENKLYPESAEEKTMAFVNNTAYYDNYLKRWCSWYHYTTNESGVISYRPGVSDTILTFLQLRGALLQAEVEPNEALQRYNELKTSYLYDENVQLWKAEYPRTDMRHDLESQLWEILLVDTLEKRGVLVAPLTPSSETTIPEERNF